MTWGGASAPPYRTRVVVVDDDDDDDDDDDGRMDLDDDDDFEEIVDRWNDGDDPTFRHYSEMLTTTTTRREKDGAKAVATIAAGGRGEVDGEDDDIDDGLDPIVDGDDVARDDVPPSEDGSGLESIYIVCYHLPVILGRDPATSTWNACWSESLISKSELHGVSSTRRTIWVGTVSNVPDALLADPVEREAIRVLLGGMDCIPVFFFDDGDDGGGGRRAGGGERSNVVDLMYLGFCKQVLWPSFHNVDLLDLAMNGWGQRQRDTNRSDPVRACQLAAEEARERKRSESACTTAEAGGAMPMSPHQSEQGGPQRPELKSDWDQRRLDSWWNAYVRVNETFSRVVADLVSGGDIVWVHDYHLALLPRMLREARNERGVAGSSVASVAAGGGGGGSAGPRAPPSGGGGAGRRVDKPVRMIFFIHVPFPTSQVFRELEHGEALLEGMLHADLIGFHAFDHARHFLNAAKRILGLTYESLVGGLIGVRYRGTKVVVAVSNVSVEADIIDALLEYPSVAEEAGALRQKHSGRSIVSGIAVAQRLSGVSYTLMAFERLLTDYPVWQSKVVLLQRCLIPGARRVDEADTLREVRWLVQCIRNRFGPEVIDYEEQVGSVLPIDQRLAIWTSSQVMIHTPIREGLNLCPLEYVYARKEPADPGVVIASEFSAVSSILNGALRVNPYDIQNFVTSIDKALSMSFNERDARRARDIDFVSTCPSGLWTRNVLRDLNDATLQSTNMVAVGESSPDAILAREAELGLKRLDLPALEHAYASTKSRVIIIDFNGTLVVKEPAGKYLKREILGTSGFKPSHITTLALRKLCSDPNNTVYVVSGDSQQNLELAVGNVPGLGLAASNGTCFADPGGQERVWQFLDFGIDWNAVKKVSMRCKFNARRSISNK
jgi:trehalose 6-phosphate synthase/phosphatase